MSCWLDLSNNSNKLRQTYFRGFVDISGGGLNIRTDASINLFNSKLYSQPMFSINADKMFIYDNSSGNVVDVKNTNLIYLKNVNTDIQAVINNLLSWQYNIK